MVGIAYQKDEEVTEL